MNKMLRVRDIVQMLGVSDRTVRRWLVEDGLPHAKLNGIVIIDPVEFEEWKKKKTETKK